MPAKYTGKIYRQNPIPTRLLGFSSFMLCPAVLSPALILWPPEKVWSELCFAKLLIINGLPKFSSLLRGIRTWLKASCIFLNNRQSTICKYFTRSRLLENCHGTWRCNYSSSFAMLSASFFFAFGNCDGFQWTDLTVDTI